MSALRMPGWDAPAPQAARRTVRVSSLAAQLLEALRKRSRLQPIETRGYTTEQVRAALRELADHKLINLSLITLREASRSRARAPIRKTPPAPRRENGDAALATFAASYDAGTAQGSTMP